MNYSFLHISSNSVVQKQLNKGNVLSNEDLGASNSTTVEKNQENRAKINAYQEVQGVVDFEGSVYAVENGNLVKYDSESNKLVKVSLHSQEKAKEEVINIRSGYGHLFVLCSNGHIYDSRGAEDSAIDSDKTIKFVQLELVPKLARCDLCEHGFKCRQERQIWAKQLDLTQEDIFVVDHLGCVWTFRRDLLTQDSVEVDQVGFGGRLVRSVCCGRAHCIALVEPLNGCRSEDLQHQQSGSGSGCEKCLENENLRLSVLMKSADKIAEEDYTEEHKKATKSQTSNSASITSCPSPPTSKGVHQPIYHKLGGRLDSLRSWNFRGATTFSPNTKTGKVWQKCMKKEIMDRPCSASKFNSLKAMAKPKLRLEKQHVHKHNSLDIELTTLKRGRLHHQQFSTDLTGSIQFSFVSLDNVLASSTDDSASTLPSETDFLLSPSPEGVQNYSLSPNPSALDPSHMEQVNHRKKPPALTHSNAQPVGFLELWSWGDNQCGQLGQNDTVSRKEPQKVRLLAAGPILKVSCGHNHTIVLMTTGEAYCFGSNANGQFKQINYQYFSQPTPLKLGSECCIVDVGGQADSTSVVVLGGGGPTVTTHTAFHFSKHHSQAQDSPTTQLEVSPTGLPVSIQPLGDGGTILLGWLNASCTSLAPDLFKATQACKTAVTLLALLDKILEQNKTHKEDKEEVGLELLQNMKAALLRWAVLLSNLAHDLRLAMLQSKDLAVGSKKKTGVASFEQDKVMSAFTQLHFSFVDVVGYGCFHDLDVGPDLESYIERLSLDYEAESSKIYRRLKNLFQLPLKNFHQIRHLVAQQPNLPVTYWKVFEHVLEKNELVASKTCSFFHQSLSSGGFDKSLRVPHRLLLWSTEHNPNTGQSVKIRCEVSNGNKSSSSTIRNFLGRGWLALIVFNNSIALIQKHDYIAMDFPLVWVSGSAEETSQQLAREGNGAETTAQEMFSARIIAPEYEFHVEFPSFEMKRDFLDSVYLMKKHKLARKYNSLEPLGSEQIRLSPNRFGQYTFSTAYPLYKGATYKGSWRAGLPHGSGHLHFPSGKEYHGKFYEGLIQGLGTMKLPLESITPSPLISSVFFTSAETGESCAAGLANPSVKCHLYKGQWKNGKVHGLASIEWANGDTFEGYCQAGQPHGHGVLRSIQPQDSQLVYVGAWQNGVKHGYGVQSTNTERYLGIWFDDQKHGKGCLISIDGTYHEGIWDRNRFVRGAVVYEQMEGEANFGGSMASQGPKAPPASFEGDFEKIGMANGKGVLQLTPYDKIVGAMYGNILSGELRITNAIYTRTNLNRNSFGAEIHIVEKEPVENQWAVPAEVKWVELFAQFLEDDLNDAGSETSGLPPVHREEGGNSLASVEADHQAMEASKRAWNRLVSTLAKLKLQKGLIFDEKLERIPSEHLVWSTSYYATVAEFWHLCITTFHHPMNRLVRGVVEVFCQSYNNIGTHTVMYDAAILEFQSLVRRTYEVVRRLFPKLPPSEQMYSAVPNTVGSFSSCTTTNNSCSSTSTEETLSMGSLINLSSLVAEASSTTSESSAEERSKAREEKEESVGEQKRDDFQVAAPCCDFVIHHLFSQCYAELFIMYSVRCEEMDRRYWERVVYLNAYTDARLLKYLDVNSELWPTDSDNTKALDTFTVRVTARRKFYESAIHTFQRLSGVFNPINKLAILAETFSEISACVSQFSSVGKNHVWTGDELLPAFIYVVVRAQLQHLGAEIRLISDFCPQLIGAGQIELMFTNLRASYVQICTDKCNP